MSVLRCTQAAILALAFGLSPACPAEPLDDAGAAYRQGDYATAHRLWSGLAEQGNATAQVRLGLMYARGHGVPRDDAEAVRWYRRAAELGSAWGETNLGYMYSAGRGVAHDDAEAVRWYRKAAERDFPMAQDNLGVMYRDGRGVAQDFATAVDWFRKAAAKGFAAGQLNLGFMYANGRGVARDDAEAVQWYRKAADQGNAIAQSNLGFMYRGGRGVARDDAQAVQWYRRAADQGYARAQTALAEMYRDGRGVAKDDAEALKWYRKAADQGDLAAKDGIDGMVAQGRGVPAAGGKGDTSSPPEPVVRRDVTIVSRIDPPFPREAIRAGITKGHVVAHVQIDEAGNVYGVTIARADPPRYFNQAASAALWEWKFRPDGEKYDAEVELRFALSEPPPPSSAGLANTIDALVRKHEAAQPAAPAPDAERVALAREIVAASGLHELWALEMSPERLKAAFSEGASNAKIPRNVRDTMAAAVAASFRAERILASFERSISALLDPTTLRTGLEWERSELGRKINRLALDVAQPEFQAVRKEFFKEFEKSGGVANDGRARACAQKAILVNSAEATLPFVEAMVAGGGMIAAAQQRQALDMDTIQRLVATVRPVLRDRIRQISLAECLFSLRRVSDAEFDAWLVFLRTDSGGRYARGVSAATREALVDAAEVFNRTMIDVVRQLKGPGET